MRYRLVQLQFKYTSMTEEEEDAAFEALHEKYAPRSGRLCLS